MSDHQQRPHRSARRLIGLVIGVTVATFLLSSTVLTRLNVTPGVDLAVEAAVLSLAVAGLLWFAVLRPLRADAEHERALAQQREKQLHTEAERQQFRVRLHRGLEMAETETHAYQVVDRALGHSLPRLATQMLLADSSEAHLKQAVVRETADGASGCGVESPRSCPAIRRAQTEIDACPHLAAQAGGDRAAVCVPMSVAGRSIGVLHTTTARDEPVTDAETFLLEAIATSAGARVGLLRVMESTYLQAATDPLTGLLNRRSLENKVQDLVGRKVSFALAMADLDHFKQLNDTHGHDAGDRALRLFANVVRRSLRTADLISRYGGEEFVIVFPDLSVADAGAALQRLQEELLVAISSGGVPPFTASFGVSHSDSALGLEELTRAADAALFQAKRAGRNRVVIDNSNSRDVTAGS